MITDPQTEKAAFAEWLARQHLRFDSRLTQAVYLPGNAPDNEVRLLEVNTGIHPESDSPIVPVETTPAIAGLPFLVSVADVTPDEWQKINGRPELLPKGWSLDGNLIFRRAV